MPTCTPCPPCEPTFPLFCEPLPTTTNAQRIVVEDEASCQKTLTKTSTPALLHQTVAGNIQFSDGSDSQLIKLPQMAEHNASEAPKIVVLLADGTIKAWEPTNSLDNFLAYWDGTAWRLGNLVSLFPSGDGVLVKNTLGTLSFVNGVAGEALQYVGSNIEFAPQSLSPVPTGLILPYAANAPIALPSGYLECDGSTVNQGIYANLFAVIGTTYNIGGEGPSDFRLPDLRGYFIRGFGTNSDLTASAAFGAKQADAFQGHRHNATTNAVSTSGAATFQSGGNGAWFGASVSVLDPITDGVNGAPRTAAETRPRNIAMRYLIKT
jgi:microcystin-dependent protein